MVRLGWIDERVIAPPPGPAPSVRVGRRLCDRILVAFHSACDQADLETANELLVVANKAVERGFPTTSLERRRGREALVAAYERLWYLRHRFEDAPE